MLVKLGCGGVELGKLHPSMRDVLGVASRLFPSEPIITSTWEGSHSPESLHYFFCALDFRLPSVNTANIVSEMKSILGKNYDIVLESDHIHVEYDPK